IPLEEFPFRERDVPESGEWRFAQAGRLIEKKGWPVTLRAFAIFLAQYPKATLTIAGEGPLLGELQNLARQLRTAERVSFTGFFSRIARSGAEIVRKKFDLATQAHRLEEIYLRTIGQATELSRSPGP